MIVLVGQSKLYLQINLWKLSLIISIYLWTFQNNNQIYIVKINCTHHSTTYFYISFWWSFALCFLFLSFAFSFDIFFRNSSSSWHLYKVRYLFAQSAFAFRCTNRNWSLMAGQKQQTEDPVMFSGLFFILFSLATTVFTFATNCGPYNALYSFSHLIDFFKCLMVLSSV